MGAREQGFTLLEAIVAIAICAIVLATLATVATSSLRESRVGNFKVQATQVLDTLGRRISGGNDLGLLASTARPLELGAEDIAGMTGIALAEVADMAVTVTNLGAYRVGGSRLDQYRVEVCYGGGNAARRCVAGITLGRQGN